MEYSSLALPKALSKFLLIAEMHTAAAPVRRISKAPSKGRKPAHSVTAQPRAISPEIFEGSHWAQVEDALTIQIAREPTVEILMDFTRLSNMQVRFKEMARSMQNTAPITKTNHDRKTTSTDSDSKTNASNTTTITNPSKQAN
jgi:hypothetical protein